MLHNCAVKGFAGCVEGGKHRVVASSVWYKSQAAFKDEMRVLGMDIYYWC